VGTEVIPNGGKGLAVTAPGGVVLNKDVLGGVVNNSIVVGTNEDGNGALGLGLLLTLEVGSKST